MSPLRRGRRPLATKPFLIRCGRRRVSVTLSSLPRYVVIEPDSTLRVDIELEAPACEIDVALDSPAPGRSVVLMIGAPGGPYAQRVRLAGRARIYFDPEAPGKYTLLLANPDSQPTVLRLKGRGLGGPRTAAGSRRKARRTGSPGRAPRRRSRSSK